MGHFSSDAELEKLVESFRAGSLREAEWHHAEHVGIAFWLLSRIPLLEAVFQLKLGIMKYNERYHVAQTPDRGYHETITMFFVKLVQKDLARENREAEPLVATVNRFLAQFPAFLPVLWTHYSRPVLNSLQARLHWVEPDLQPL